MSSTGGRAAPQPTQRPGERAGPAAEADWPQLAQLLQAALQGWARILLRRSPSGYKPAVRRKGSGRKRGGQPGHPGSGPELLPIERVDEVVEHHPEACRRCDTLLDGEDPTPLGHQVIEIPPITPLVIEQRLHRLVCPFYSTSTCPPHLRLVGS